MNYSFGLLLSTAAFVGLLSGCGGGDTDQPTPSISFYGDSYTHAFVPHIAQSMNNKFVVYNRALPGATSSDAINGTWRISDTPQPFATFQSFVGTDPATVIVIRYGVADVVLGTDAMFEANADKMITATLATGKRPILVNVVGLPSTVYFTDQLLSRIDLINKSIDRLSIKYSISVIDLHTTVSVPIESMHPDGVHLTNDTSLQVDKVIADNLIRLVR